ncbi:MAG: hypothetical protein ABIS07_13195 [Dokdonella sp.]
MATCRWLAVAVLLALPMLANAITWPGASPCDGTLQGCINSASAGATVEVASNATVDEDLSFGIPLTLRAASGYAPQLAVDRNIYASANSDGTYAIEGITLQRGTVYVAHGGGAANVRVRRVRVLEANAIGSPEITIGSTTSTALTYEIAENDVSLFWNTYDGGLHAAIQVLSSNTGTRDGRIHDNHVDAAGSWSAGILVSSADSTHTTRVYGNWVRGGNSYGSIDLRQGNLVGTGSGSLNAYVLNNVVTPLAGSGDAYGIAVDAYFGNLDLQAFNNTVSGAYSGINVYVASGATGNGRIANNLFAGDILSLALSHGGSGTISNDHNLLYGGSISGPSPGAGTITSNPLLRGAPGNPWLNPTSPAIDAADSLALDSVLTSAAIARVDGAGLRRFKGGSNLADIGALEFGDTTFLHRVSNATPNPYSEIDNASVDGLSSHFLQVTPNWNPDGATGIYDNHPSGVFFNSISGHWDLRHEDLVAFPNDARFNVFSPAYGNGSFHHVVTGANIAGDATSLTIGGLDNQPNRILLATRDSLDSDNTLYDDPHPFGVFYFSFGGPGNWFISHFDSTAMTAGGGYHVYWQEPSANAFIHAASAGNSSGDYTVLDHPLLNGHACARFHVTQGIGGAVFNAHQTGVFYAFGRWAIYNQDITAIPVGTQFHVVVDAQQVFECSDVIFADGLE